MKAKRRSAGAEGHYLNWLLAILVIAILLALLVPGVSAGWSYRRNITITDAGTDLTYLVTLSSGQYGNMKDDGSDLRFTDRENSVKYNYWIEKWDKNGESKIWVKVPGVPSGDPPIYMWYGNSDAIPESNGAATFTFFDDFDNDNIDNWKEELFYSKSAHNHSVISAVNNKLVVETTASPNRAGACTKAVQLSQGQKFEAKVVSRIDGANLMQVIYKSKDHLYENGPYASGTYKVWRKDGTGEATGLYSGSAVEAYPCYPYVEYGTDGYVHFGTNGEEVCNESSTLNAANFKLGFYSYPSGTIKIDWVFVRKYASPEPETTVGAQGGTGGGAPVPELPSVILFSVGLIVLAGYVSLRRREKKKGE